MSAFIASISDVIAQSEGSGGSGKGDSSLLFIILMVVIGLVVVTAILLVIRARAPEHATSARDGTLPRESSERGSSGRPLHVDPDPDNLAGGRARMTDPLKDSGTTPHRS